MCAQFIKYIGAIAAAFILASCVKEEPKRDSERNVMIMMSLGFHNLSTNLSSDLKDLWKGWLPSDGQGENVLLIYSHQTSSSGVYSKATSPVLYRLYSKGGKAVADTLLTFPKGVGYASASTIGEVLQFAYSKFTAKSYGVIMSSHGTGWLPEDYYSHPDRYDNGWSASPLSFGAELYKDPSSRTAYEIDITDLAAAITIPLDYMIFDACLMGGVEVAYAMAGKVRKIAFSPAEVLAQGLDYKGIAKHLIGGENPDVNAVVEDFYQYYNKLTGLSHSMTASVVDCSRLFNLSQTCKRIFENYRTEINSLNLNDGVMNYGGSFYTFFDLLDLVRKAGVKEKDLRALETDLEQCVVFKRTTGQYYSDTDSNVHPIDDEDFCGLTMYLPSVGTEFLDNYYKTLAWNKATGLVK